MAIDVKQATAIAARSLVELLPGSEDISLEEVELSDDDRFWYITLSALVPAPESPLPEIPKQIKMTSLADIMGHRQRVYKVFTINGEDGTVRSMKIRKPE